MATLDLRPSRPTRAEPPHGGVAWVRRHPVASQVGLAIAFSWAYWIPLAVAGGDGSHVPGLVGPALAGVVVTSLIAGRAGVADLLRRVGRWRVAPRWYAAALAPLAGGALGVALLAASGDAVDLDALQTFPGLPDVGWVGIFVLALVVNGLGEEIGWRGVIWPRLRERHGLAAAAGLLALPWAVWHVPTFWLASGLDLEPWIIPGWVLGLAAGAVVLGWLYERSGSLFVVALFHAGLNMSSATLGTEGLPAAITSMGVIVAAVVILRQEGGGRPV